MSGRPGPGVVLPAAVVAVHPDEFDVSRVAVYRVVTDGSG